MKLTIRKKFNHYTGTTEYRPLKDGNIILGREVGVCGQTEADCMVHLDVLLAKKGYSIADFKLVAA